jgi:hypothetical protein
MNTITPNTHLSSLEHHQPGLELVLPDGRTLEHPVRMEMARHSGTRFFQRYPEVGEVVKDLAKEGVTISEIALIIAPHVGREVEMDEKGKVKDSGLRKLIERYLTASGIKMGAVTAGKAAMVASEALSQALNIIPKATVKELGALSMTATQATQIEREQAGVSLPPVRHVHLHVTPADLERMHEEAAAVDTRQVDTRHKTEPIIDA